ncbi:MULTISPECIES: hypothetical protein [Aquitalea]|jgi:type VI secretion system secreted protein VgrG|uniref:hypothetical protein n=1 Tax=Aquitalea TaxID=407217 RepID=UPI00135A609A|nr:MULTISPECIES: hypothetical protein [Aquitalea]
MRNPYQHSFPDRQGLAISVHSFTLDEALDTPYLRRFTVVRPGCALALVTLIDRSISFIITSPPSHPLPVLSGMTSPSADPAQQHCWHGMVRKDHNLQETRYRFSPLLHAGICANPSLSGLSLYRGGYAR